MPKYPVLDRLSFDGKDYEAGALIDRSRQDVARLNDVLERAKHFKVGNIDEIRAQVEVARASIQEGLLKPFNDMVEASDRQRAVQLLVLQGREREAEVLQRVQQLQQQQGEVTDEQRARIADIVAQEEKLNDLLSRREAIIGAYMDSLGDVRSALTQLLAGGSVGDFTRSLRQNVRRLRAELLSENLFGDGFRALQQQIRRSTGLEGVVEELGAQTRETSVALGRVADAANSAAARLTGATTLTAGSAPANALALTSAERAKAAATASDEIVVTAAREKSGKAGGSTVNQMRQSDYFNQLGRVMVSPIVQLLQQIDDSIGTKLTSRLSGVLQGAASGYLQAGAVGGVLGGLNSLGIKGAAGAAIKNGLGGAQTGAQTAEIMKSLGIKTSKTGAEIGGAIGSAIPIPGGEIIGSILGGLVGGALKKAKKGSATVTSVTSDATITGNNAGFKRQSGDLASQFQDSFSSIVQQLGGTVGAFNLSLGVRDGKLRLDPTGQGITKKKKGAVDFGEDSAGLIRAAILDAIGDGGAQDLSAAVSKALKSSSSDLDKAVKEALKVKQVEDLLGGLGTVLQQQFRDFEAQAKERVRIARQYGFDVTAIEKRNAEDRQKLVDSILQERVGGLKDFLQQLKFGDLFEGSAVDRRAALQTEIAKARADAESGVDGAAQKLADLQRQLVETSKEAFGTAGPEYGSDRANAITAAERVIALENDRIKAAQDAALATRDAVQQSNSLLGEANDQLARISAQLAGFGGGAPAEFGNAALASVLRQASL